MKKRNILMDCDPGIDDCIAIGIAVANTDKFNICGITTVAGNQTLDHVTENALKLLSFLGANIPVARGADTPLIRQSVSAANIHGESGIGYCILPATSMPPVSDSAVSFLHKKIMALPENEQMTLVATGPLTNIALLLKSFPAVSSKINEICLMGGAITGGNSTATAEFNIWEDPEAAKIVFSSGLPIIMCGLDVTFRSGLYKEHIDEFLASTSPIVHAFGEMLDYYFCAPVFAHKKLLGIHDATTIMYLLHPELFATQNMYVDIDCSEDINRGMTICDTRDWLYKNDSKVKVLISSDLSAYQKFLLEEIHKFN